LKTKVTKKEKDVFEEYKRLIVRWDKTHNLMSAKGIKELDLHIEDALSVSKKIQADSLIDMGSGAGFPGLPLAIKLKNKFFYLVESNQKKASFLINATNTLELENIKVVNERIQDYKPTKNQLEIITRAFGDINTTIKAASKILDRGSLLRMMKTSEEDITDNLKKKYKIISTENIYSQLRSNNLLVTVGLH
jgi:16S rRNA (guanine527-N7)-methyltransferase